VVYSDAKIVSLTVYSEIIWSQRSYKNSTGRSQAPEPSFLMVTLDRSLVCYSNQDRASSLLFETPDNFEKIFL
jgi:hypothetical protein